MTPNQARVRRMNNAERIAAGYKPHACNNFTPIEQEAPVSDRLREQIAAILDKWELRFAVDRDANNS